MEIKLGTFNTQHCKDFAHFVKTGEEVLNYELMSKTVRELGIDICGLQEMRGKGISDGYLDQTKIIAERLGYHYYFGKAFDFAQGPYGNSVISKFPILFAQTIIIPSTHIKEKGIYCYEDRSVIRAEFDVPGGLTLFVCHMGLSRQDRIRAVEYCMREIGKAQDGRRIVFMGDFNTRPHEDILQPVKDAMFDVSDLIIGDKTTFPSMDDPKNLTEHRKIDYIFTNDKVKVLSAQIPDNIAADHKLHTAVIEV